MLLAVAGLSEDEVQTRIEQLSTGEWSGFPPAERQALIFAEKLTRHPAEVTTDDIQQLRETFGDARAVDVIWYVSWCNYMTRVADGLQLPLETDNVFMNPESTEEPAPAAGDEETP